MVHCLFPFPQAPSRVTSWSTDLSHSSTLPARRPGTSQSHNLVHCPFPLLLIVCQASNYLLGSHTHHSDPVIASQASLRRKRVSVFLLNLAVGPGPKIPTFSRIQTPLWTSLPLGTPPRDPDLPRNFDTCGINNINRAVLRQLPGFTCSRCPHSRPRSSVQSWGPSFSGGLDLRLGPDCPWDPDTAWVPTRRSTPPVGSRPPQPRRWRPDGLSRYHVHRDTASK